MAATCELQRLNSELEHRIAEKSEEIKSTYARVEEAKREWTLVSERQRILADMHDGVGASLVGLLRHVQSGSADRVSIEKRVQEVLQEMRIAIDALQPRDGDLAAVLGALRYRLDDIIRSSGVRLAWEVEELPDVGELKPSTVFALQRIVLEAITNALKHSGAQCLRLSARACNGDVEVRIEDDGRGFDTSRHAAGLGLVNMRARAQRIGARLKILSHPGKGTTVRLSLPRATSRAAVPEAA
jgi:signal transduction histidine kinase